MSAPASNAPAQSAGARATPADSAAAAGNRCEPSTAAARLRRADADSAPPYPYEGDLPIRARTRRRPSSRSAPRPGSRWYARPRPGAAALDWIGPRRRRARTPRAATRHRGAAAVAGRSGPSRRPVGAVEPPPGRPSYDPSTFPRRLAVRSPACRAQPSGYTPPPAYSGFGSRAADRRRTGQRPVTPAAADRRRRRPAHPSAAPTRAGPAGRAECSGATAGGAHRRDARAGADRDAPASR